MIRVVIDTNILVSAVMNRHGPSAQVFGLILAGLILPCVTDAVLREYHGTLNISSHEPDNRFYECADAGKADYIVTGNTRHFKKPHKTTKIVTARQLLDIVAAGKR